MARPQTIDEYVLIRIRVCIEENGSSKRYGLGSMVSISLLRRHKPVGSFVANWSRMWSVSSDRVSLWGHRPYRRH